MSEWAQVHIPCPCGKGSDCYSINTDGWGTCFTCGDRFDENGVDRPQFTERPKFKENAKMTQPSNKDFKYVHMVHRGITETTMKKYNTLTKIDADGTPIETGFQYSNGFYKIRSHLIPKKSPGHFRTTGSPKEGKLFGEDKFEPGSSDTIIITEGEYDAMAAHQMTTLPAVSLRSGSSSARNDLKGSWDYVNSFSKIILAFDNDEAGQQATQKCAGLFDYNKVFVAQMVMKDANDYLVAKDYEGFVQAIRKAKKFSPDNVISTFGEMRKALKDSSNVRICTYPFSGLQDALFGIYQDEIICFKADTGIGKTEVFRAMEHHALKTEPDAKICIIHMEEGNGTTLRGLATYEERFPYIHLDDHTDDDTIMAVVEKAVGEEGRVHIYESFDTEDENRLLDTVRYLVSTAGVNMVFLDHITWLATGRDGDENERRTLDRISQKLKLLAKELHFAFIFISHTNDEGKTRGSRNIVKVANTVIHLDRDPTAENETERHQMRFIIEKGRGHGTRTGPAGYAVFDTSTLCLEDPQTDFELPTEKEQVA